MRRRAVSLMEVVVSSAVALLCMLCITALLIHTLRAMRHADGTLQAESYAREQLNAVRATPLPELEVGMRPAETREGFRRETEILAPPTGIEPERMKEIRVTVTWKERGRERKLRRGVFYAGTSD